MHSIGFLLCANKPEWKLALKKRAIMSLHNPKPVYDAAFIDSRSCSSTGFVSYQDFAICGWWRWRMRMWLWRPSLWWYRRWQWLYGTGVGRGWCTASERQYIAGGGEVQLSWGDIHEWRKVEIDTRIGEANAVLCELDRSVVTKRELSNTVKLSGFKWVFVQILPYGHDSWVMTEIVSANGRGGIFAKSSWRDTWRQSAQLRNS